MGAHRAAFRGCRVSHRDRRRRVLGTVAGHASGHLGGRPRAVRREDPSRDLDHAVAASQTLQSTAVSASGGGGQRTGVISEVNLGFVRVVSRAPAPLWKGAPGTAVIKTGSLGFALSL